MERDSVKTKVQRRQCYFAVLALVTGCSLATGALAQESDAEEEREFVPPTPREHVGGEADFNLGRLEVCF